MLQYDNKIYNESYFENSIENCEDMINNEDNAWNTLTTVENIHSLNVLKTVTFEVDNNMNISYSSPSDDLIITAEIDENGYASVYIN